MLQGKWYNDIYIYNDGVFNYHLGYFKKRGGCFQCIIRLNSDLEKIDPIQKKMYSVENAKEFIENYFRK